MSRGEICGSLFFYSRIRLKEVIPHVRDGKVRF
nr:MAG TPA: hypothetical protein [Caudoviricetes sp.]